MENEMQKGNPSASLTEILLAQGLTRAQVDRILTEIHNSGLMVVRR